MNDIKVIRNLEELEGSCYIELFAGAYKGKCWNVGSLFFIEEVFGFIEPIIKKFVSNYDHYAFVDIDASIWAHIAKDIELLIVNINCVQNITELKELVSFYFDSDTQAFDADFMKNKSLLVVMLRETCDWLNESLNRCACITILGM